MISNSVAHLQIYTNTTIADIGGKSTPILPETPPKCRYRHTERRYCHIKWRVFHDVLRVTHDVLLVVHNVLLVVQYVLHMFHDDLRCSVSCATIAISASTAADCLRDRDIAAGIGDNSAEVSPCYTPS